MEAQAEKTVFDDLAQLEKTLTEDTSGDRARAMLGYFDEVARASEAMLSKQVVDAERQLVSHLIEGFRAAQRIIRHVWETLHTASLAA
ncbi:hypothetical protein OOT46_20800 [Aquabacterium sp. A7-Y]|uniref:hypothetical protein n=1 Tax=Aquabacterium sp. A7-Y TaxID=1349605 RepID=UPI00223E77FA|nr:hypothetical protein [Aquabacterium sp. A7-Y]MCW7540277.1 hypothetical protein [Aquabacterium sp. A7-Y]